MFDFVSDFKSGSQILKRETLIKVNNYIADSWKNPTASHIRHDVPIGQCWREFQNSLSSILFFLNDITDGGLRIQYGSLFQIVSAA